MSTLAAIFIDRPVLGVLLLMLAAGLVSLARSARTLRRMRGEWEVEG